MLMRKDLNFEEFKTLLKRDRELVEKNIKMLAIESDTLVRNDDVGDLADAAEVQIDTASDRAILNQLKAKLVEIDAALGRIKAGSYGICEKTGEVIPADRLRANPVARTVVNV